MTDKSFQILVVDDDPDVLAMLERAMKPSFAEMQQATKAP